MPTSAFCYRPMPTFGSCDSTRSGALNRYIVELKPVIRTISLSRLTRCRHCDDHDLHTLLLCAKRRRETIYWPHANWLARPHCAPCCARKDTCAHGQMRTLFFSPCAWNQSSDALATLAVAPFSLLLPLLSKAPLWGQKGLESGEERASCTHFQTSLRSGRRWHNTALLRHNVSRGFRGEM